VFTPRVCMHGLIRVEVARSAGTVPPRYYTKRGMRIELFIYLAHASVAAKGNVITGQVPVSRFVTGGSRATAIGGSRTS
jgi:hypothetical protein